MLPNLSRLSLPTAMSPADKVPRAADTASLFDELGADMLLVVLQQIAKSHKGHGYQGTMTVCRTVKSLCSANKGTRDTCLSFDTATWKQMLRAVFAPGVRESLERNNVLETVLYDETRPRASFYKLCTAVGLSNVLARNFFHTALTIYKRALFNQYVLSMALQEAPEPTAREWEEFDYEYWTLPDLPRVQPLLITAREQKDDDREFKDVFDSYYYEIDNGLNSRFRNVADVFFSAVIRAFLGYMEDNGWGGTAEWDDDGNLITWLDDTWTRDCLTRLGLVVASHAVALWSYEGTQRESLKQGRTRLVGQLFNRVISAFNDEDDGSPALDARRGTTLHHALELVLWTV